MTIELRIPRFGRLDESGRTERASLVRSLALLGCRAIVGGIFAVHGYAKVFGGPGATVSPVVARCLGPGFVQSMDRGGVPATAVAFHGMGIPAPDLLARFVSFLELGGGVLTVLGLLTRPFALLLAGDMAVAIQKVHWRIGLLGPGGLELPLALIAGCLGLVGAGAGDFSIDHLFCPMSARRRVKRASTTGAATVLVSALALGAVVVRLARRDFRAREPGPFPRRTAPVKSGPDRRCRDPRGTPSWL
jgi:putative oxidoreductase